MIQTISKDVEVILDGKLHLLEAGDRVIVEDLSGEWWIDDGGQDVFADGDVGEYNHAMLALGSALGVDLEDPKAPEIIPFDAFSPEAIAWLRSQGAEEKAIEYLKDGSDPRDYALENMGWIRVHGSNFATWEFNELAKENIASFVYERLSETGDDPETSNEEIYVEQVMDHQTWSIPVSLLLREGLGVEELKQLVKSRR